MAHKTRGEQRAENDKKAVSAMFDGMLAATKQNARMVPQEFRHKKNSWLLGFDLTEQNREDN